MSMKRNKFLVLAALAVASLGLLQCGSESGPSSTPQDDQLKKLAGKTWKATEVTFTTGSSPAPQSGYSNFTITMTGTKGADPFDYETNGRPATSPWGATGKFTFDATDFATVMTRDDLSGVG